MDFLSIIMPYLHLSAGLAALILCGNWLVTGGVQLARHFKISKLIIGLTIVAFGTSAPELFVCIEAAFKGAPEIALGNVIGSNIANIALVIGFTALILPIPANNKSILFNIFIMLAVTILLFGLGYNGVLGRIEGICLVSILFAYIVWSVIKEKRKNANEESETAAETVIEKPAMKPLAALLLIGVSVTGMYFGSEWFVNGAREIAIIWGVSERVIGISIVALGTSMPELVTSVIAAFRKEMDISIGNIVGSNIFNIVMVLGTTAIIKPLNIAVREDSTIDIIRRGNFTIDMIWVFVIALLLLAAMIPFNEKTKISRWKGGILLALYAVYIYLLFGL